MPRFSIAIPNYNYGHYIGETIGSVLAQGRSDVEIHVSDNASTDDSVAVIQAFGEGTVRLSRNVRNLGFAANLDRAVAPTTGQFVILLSSDDLMRAGALDTYSALLDTLGDKAEHTVVASAIDMVDSDGVTYDQVGPLPSMWRAADEDPTLSAAMGCRVLRAPAAEVLRRSLLVLRNPTPFCSTLYPRRLYDEVGGYGANRLIVPDKFFHWKLLSVANEVVYVDRPLFGYRVHQTNQAAQQQGSGALKLLVDEYAATFDLEPEVLEAAGLDRQDLTQAFLRADIVERGLAEVHAGRWLQARRMALFGWAAYPRDVVKMPGYWALRISASLGPVGSAGVRAATQVAAAMAARRRSVRP